MLNAALLRRIAAVFFAVVLVSQNVAAALPAAVDNQPLPTLAPMLEKTTPAVVNIATTGRIRLQQNPLLNDPFFRRFFDFPDQPRERQTQSLGSGVVIDAQQGYVLTNHHVIDKAEKIRVVLSDGRAFDADVIGTDSESDVAVIRIPAERLTAVTLANSDTLRVGDFVVAIGNPFGLGQTVTSGIVSALGRSGLGIEGYEDFIQTDASINPGNSGGALVNLRGELVGINTAILAPGGGNVGIGFAIPINMAHKIMDQLVTHGKISRGQLGVTAQDLTPELAQAFGLKAQRGTVIAEVVKGSPADRAGLKVGDIIQRVNGRRIESSADVRNHIGLLRVGESVSLDIVRNGRNQHIKAVIEAPKLTYLDGGRLHPRLAGARFSDIAEGMPQYGRNTGILLSELDPRSPAAQTGLKEGDIVASANQKPVKSINDLETILGNGSGGGLLLNVQRGNGALFLLIR
ncbi:MAG: DegQ family serine endoprotease [Gammaproteobacteria bacterium]|nr:DegQ family serine endoprotease [Gammaproteobacteria bacterium]MBU2477855.1 DegQ family serine endoprotease [Gammaproteobacteria bacterium]